MTIQRPKLTIHARGRRTTEPAVRPGANLLPRDLFTGHPDVLVAYDELTNVLESKRHHERESARLRAEATKADDTYRAKIRDSLVKGTDVDKIKNRAHDLTTQANERAKLADRANELAKLKGRDLAVVMQAAAPDLYAGLDAALESAATRVEEAIAQVDEAITAWGTQWEARLILSQLHLFGGSVGNYNPDSVRPREYNDAVAAIRDLLGNAARLRADEAQIHAERAADREAQASLTRSIGATA